jgi:hypothetical protein
MPLFMLYILPSLHKNIFHSTAGLTIYSVELFNMMIKKPELTLARISEIQEIIAKNPLMGRSKISVEICRKWDWRSPNGQWKDISARDMLRALDKAGKIVLPPPLSASRQAGKKHKCKHLEHDTTPVCCPLSELLPIQLEAINDSAALAEFKSYIDQYHYLAFDRTVGENMKYLARDCYGRPLSCQLFGSAAWSCADRDHFIGWDKYHRTQNLHFLTNQTRFLIFPWVRVDCLASHILALTLRRIAKDWERKYGHGLAAIETYVEIERFRGTVYQAANWLRIGRTTGRGRNGGHHHAVLPKKDIYLYPLRKDYREILRVGAMPKEVGGRND